MEEGCTISAIVAKFGIDRKSDYGNAAEAVNEIRRWFMFYNHEPPHQSLATERLGTFMSKSEKNLTEQKEKHLENRTHPSLNLCYFCLFRVQRMGTTSAVFKALCVE